MSRMQNSFRNMTIGILGQIGQMIMLFVCRTVFIYTLSSEYLGINGLFSNILSVLSLAELGFGSALIYSMYKPLAEDNRKELISLMNLYRYIYIIVAIVIFILGLCLVPFLDLFISDHPSIDNLTLIYLLYLINSVGSYLLVYKKSIIEADQKNYISISYQKGFSIIQNMLQIIFLLITHNFIVYLLIQILVGVFVNIVLSKKADTMYPYLNSDKKSLPGKTVRRQIAKNTFAMSLHRIGSVAVDGSDNLIMSAFVGLESVGIYSNYVMIKINVDTFVKLIFNSFTASIGNLGVTESNKKLNETYRKMNFLGFWIYSFCATALFTLFNPFIKIWIGDNYLFSKNIVFLIVLNFYVTGMRQVTLKFRDALGLFWHDRYKPVFEAVINLVLSIILVKKFGIAGILIGTFSSTIATCFWIEPYILFKYGLNRRVREFFINYFIYTLSFILCGSITYYFCSLIPNYNLVYFVIKIFLVFFVYNLLLAVLYFRTFEFKELFRIVRNLFISKFRTTSKK